VAAAGTAISPARPRPPDDWAGALKVKGGVELAADRAPCPLPASGLPVGLGVAGAAAAVSAAAVDAAALDQLIFFVHQIQTFAHPRFSTRFFS
jgi:hypothetical protein